MSPSHMDDGASPDSLRRLERRWQRERRARQDAEAILENKSLELYQANRKLQALAEALEAQVKALDAERARVQYMAETDAVTGLANRHRYATELENWIAKPMAAQDSFAVLLLDLDNFKHINDTLGHDAGDCILKEIGARLRMAVRQEDLVARLGGDEFALLVRRPGAHSYLTKLTTRILEEVEKPVAYQRRKLQVRCSAGFAIFPDDAETAGDLLRYADIALYRSKANGRGQWTAFDMPMRLQVENRRSLETAVQKAVANGDIEPWFQPIIDTHENKIYGLEILARWERPGHGPVSPAVFIPMVEELGLIKDMTMQLFVQAAPWTHKWVKNAGLRSVSLNISPQDMAGLNFVDDLQEVLEAANFPENCLTVEITENLLHENFDLVSKHVINLSERGTRIALDDFGTGYSNIQSLKDLPIDVVKLDRSLINDIARDPRSSRIISALLGLFDVLGIKTIAEGIETDQQATVLHQLGCRYMQGFLWSRPMRAQDIDETFNVYRGGCLNFEKDAV